MLILDPFL